MNRSLTRFRPLLALVTLIAAVTAADIAPIAALEAPALRVEVAPGDSFRIIASWPAVVDGQTPAPTYAINWSWQQYPLVTAFPTPGPSRTKTGTADTVVIGMPNYPDSLLVAVNVTAKRTTYSAPTTYAQRFFRKPNPTPPAVTTITLDTAGTP